MRKTQKSGGLRNRTRRRGELISHIFSSSLIISNRIVNYMSRTVIFKEIKFSRIELNIFYSNRIKLRKVSLRSTQHPAIHKVQIFIFISACNFYSEKRCTIFFFFQHRMQLLISRRRCKSLFPL